MFGFSHAYSWNINFSFLWFSTVNAASVVATSAAYQITVVAKLLFGGL
jgi:hypothetical protein